MSEPIRQEPALMMHASLEALPPLDLPKGMQLRSFQEDDDEAWSHIISVSFKRPYDFNEHMKKDSAYQAERVLFVLVDGVFAATAAAWQVEKTPADTGYLHMVGALPEYKGRKLGYFISLAAMHKLRQEGFSRVSLNTDDFRLPAIKTYLSLGFVPDLLMHLSMPERWEKIYTLLNNKEKGTQ